MSEAENGLPEREGMDFDVVIGGAGPAGLAAAIRLRQLAAEHDREISVVVLEKGSEVGAHILSGAVIDPVGLNTLLPNWKELGAPVTQEVTDDRFLYLGAEGELRLPNFAMPPLMSNHGNYIVSLGDLVRWLGEQATNLGAEVYPGFPAAEVLRNSDGAVVGVATGDMGVDRHGKVTERFTRGMELRGKYTLIAEGAHGSLTKQLVPMFGLREGRDPQKYGIGLKELWQVKPEQHKPGLVQHTLGWPLDDATGGGSFLYHYGDNLVAVGFVVHLNYANPYLAPFEEFQRFKTHPAIAPVFAGGKRIGYGARAITEGGWQSIPKLAFPGGALIGCSAGFINLPRIKGSHNAILSGILAAEAAFAALGEGRANDELASYEASVKTSAIAKDLRRVRNVKPLLTRLGTRLGTIVGGAEMWLNTLFPFLRYTLKHGKTDAAATGHAADFKPIAYPRPDGVLTFDRLSSVFLSGTNHEEDQPVHLVLKDPSIPIRVNLPEYAEPAQRYCPAAVYEIVEEAGQKRFQINAQNCVHCKTCDIKDPSQNINWVPPEGAGGPNYAGM
ncbi:MULTISPECIES: electron transfer flavoprotein-ubiquinone oxidoreductase [Rhodomicrobium]|uniref:electron transfer flavoprotein-ubiquinone oxidoreductase n=1 Tax=Rhodomicrobium TaxID=1068 RepID=UPI000B4B283C|nr:MULTISPECIES: electron transfer flavoprotein-ubiquinone oxidoreductase [Rhodomicrobium]